MFGRTLARTSLALFFLSGLSTAQADPPKPTGAAPVAGAVARDYDRSVVPITSVHVRGPLVEAEFGTGFCLDSDCQFIVTNYHVAATVGHPKIRGAKIVKRYFATGPKDERATLNHIATGGPPLRYTLSRDLAVLQLSKPLRNYHGVQFSTEDLAIGQQVDIYSYPKGAVSPFRTLQVFHGAFLGQQSDDLLAFEYAPNGNKRLRPGASGGIVVDSESGKVVGIFCGLDQNNPLVAVAVPAENLAEFLEKTQPFLAEAVFPIQTVASADHPDFYPEYHPKTSTILRQRPDSSADSAAIKLLRENAESMLDGMRDFIAVQTFVWGRGDHHVEAADAYEVQIRAGSQKFREYPDGKKWQWSPSIPGAPSSVVTPIDDWSTLPWYIGTNVGVKIREVPGASVNGVPLRVFQYRGSAEDEPCQTRDIYSFVFFSIHKDIDSIPYGEVWTDKHENIVRMSLHCEDHAWGWTNGDTIVTYGWISKPGLEPRLVPVSIVYKASRKKQLYWCRGQFVNYREFVSRMRVLADEGAK